MALVRTLRIGRIGGKGMKRILLYLGVALVVVAGVASVYVWRSGAATGSDGPVRAAVVERGTMQVAVSASGSIKPLARVSLTFDSPGRVAEVSVEVGDVVEAGDVLARLESEQLELQVRQSRAALALAEAQLAGPKADPRPEEIQGAEANLRAAEAQVRGAVANLEVLEEGASDAQIAAAEAEVSRAVASLDVLADGASDAEIAAAEADLASALSQQKVALDAHDRTMKCVRITLPDGEQKKICPGLGTPEEQARFGLHAADGAVTAAQARLDELLAGADVGEIRAARASVASATASLDELLAGTDDGEIRVARANVASATAQRDASQAQLDLLLAGSTDEQIDAAEAQVAQAGAALELAELALRSATLRAPFGGVVASVDVTAGEMSSGGVPAIELLDPSRFHLTVSVDEMDVARLAEGQEATVSLDALPSDALYGIVERIAPAARLEAGVVYYDVTIGLDPSDSGVRADMTANASIIVEEIEDVLMIPTWVVRVDRQMGQAYVQREVGEDVDRVDVELGVRHEGVAQVLDGLSEGDTVIWLSESDQGLFSPQ